MMLWLLPLKRYFKFDGRSGRAEYWQFIAFYIVLVLICAVIDDSVSNPYQPDSSTLTLIAVLALTVPTYAVSFRRLHDRNLSGWLVTAELAAGFIGGFFGAIHARLAGSVIGVPFLLVQYAAYLASFAIAIYLVWQFCLPGEPGPNRYGAPPTDTAANAPKLHEVVASVGETARGFAPKPTHPDRLAQLERLSRLRQDGVLTDAEFEQQKAALLAQPDR